VEETDVDPSPDTRSEHPQEEPARSSEEDARTLVEQLRSAPAEQVVAEVFSTLLTAAEVKLGRRDARLFIDLCASTLDHARDYVPDELAQQVDTVLGQLRLGQVSAESQLVENGTREPNDLSRIPTPPTPGTRQEAPTGGRSTEPSSRLWVPGR
jgi:hypothetical protein